MLDLADELQEFRRLLEGFSIEVVLELLFALFDELGILVPEELLGWETFVAQLDAEVLEFRILSSKFILFGYRPAEDSEALLHLHLEFHAVLDLVSHKTKAVVRQDSPPLWHTNDLAALLAAIRRLGGFFDFAIEQPFNSRLVVSIREFGIMYFCVIHLIKPV